MQMRHRDFIGQVVPTEFHLDLKFLINGKLLRAKKREPRLAQFVDQGIPLKFLASEFGGCDFHCDSLQATISHEKVSNAAGAGCDTLSHPSMILADSGQVVNPVSFRTLAVSMTGILNLIYLKRGS